MKKLILFLFILIEIPLFGQQAISGTVVDAETNEALPYVNIGVSDRNIGTVSDIDGRFSIEIPDSAGQDLLRFSMLGYEAVYFATLEKYLETYPGENAIVSLRAESIQLANIEITDKGFKEKRLGSNTESSMIIAGFMTDQLGSEIGVRIKLGKKKPAWIQEFRFHVAQNPYDSAFFRINIYSLGKDGMPDANLLDQNMIVVFTDRSGLVSVDLKDQLVFAEDDFMVGLEYIRDLEPQEAGGEEKKKLDLAFSAGFLGNPVYSRQTSQGTWEKTSGISLGFNVLVKY